MMNLTDLKAELKILNAALHKARKRRGIHLLPKEEAKAERKARRDMEKYCRERIPSVLAMIDAIESGRHTADSGSYMATHSKLNARKATKPTR